MPSDTLAVRTQPVVQQRPDTLFAAALVLLRNRPAHMTYQMISDDTGLPADWIRVFARGHHDGSTTRVQCLWEHMTGRKLDVDYPLSASHYL